LANVLFDQGHLDQAIAHYQKALEADPGFVEAHFNLGNALLNSGRFDEAVAQYKKVLELQPAYGGAFNNLGTAYTQLGRVSEAMGAYRKALDLQPENTDALNNLAWALATCPQAALRDGAAALALAKKGVQLTGDKNPLLLRTLAAAYAETGSYGMAAVTARRALDLAIEQKNDALAATLQKEIKLYEAGMPARESTMVGSEMARPREAPQRGEPTARDAPP
jgi:tetratricopeptide (TPR) repeat protein